jgi:hypothetical protein
VYYFIITIINDNNNNTLTTKLHTCPKKAGIAKNDPEEITKAIIATTNIGISGTVNWKTRVKLACLFGAFFDWFACESFSGSLTGFPSLSFSPGRFTFKVYGSSSSSSPPTTPSSS